MLTGDAQAYRRGVALGFTLAELFTLLLFLLVLILATLRPHEKTKIERVDSDLRKMTIERSSP